ncbi:MAG: FtsK/SpoIIIE domain-containing protein [Gemmataceae bacterium]
MPTPLSTRRIRSLLRDLQGACAARSKAESETSSQYAATSTAARRSFETAREATEKRRKRELAAEDERYRQAREHLLASSEAELKAAKAHYGQAREAAVERYGKEEEATRTAYQETVWAQDASLEARLKKTESIRHVLSRKFVEAEQATIDLRDRAIGQVQRWSMAPSGIDGAAATALPDVDDVPAKLTTQIEAAESALEKLRSLVAPRLLVRDRWLLVVFVLWIALALAGFYVLPSYWGPVAATAATVVAGIALRLFLGWRVKTQGAATTRPLFQALAEAERLRAHGIAAAEARAKVEGAEAKRSHKEEVRKAEKLQREQLAATMTGREEVVGKLDRDFSDKTAALASQRDLDIHEVDSEHRTTLATINGQADTEIAKLTAKYSAEQADAERQRDAKFQALAEAWRSAVHRDAEDLTDIYREDQRLFPDWSGPLWSAWQPPTTVPPAMRFGAMEVDVAEFPGGQPDDERLPRIEPEKFSLPALLPFPERCSTVLTAEGPGRTAGVNALQAMMLRFLTSLPPGKVRFTIVDPVGLGENFAAFMHLADYDEQLVGSRIWTETGHIEKRLSDLTGHMENVIQKYLRNQYASIEEYNAQAGEVAEPYRVLVAANFPVNFSLEACRRLVSIASSGASCGVYALVSVDVKQPLPQGFPLSDLEAACLRLNWQGNKFRWEDPDFGPQALTLDAPPDAGTIAKAVHVVGAKAKDASRVEVDFSFIAPPGERWWTDDSRSGISVPLGRAGATKRQFLSLGKGTSQHALVAGKTGSGKSTLLHALITNLALHYSPREVELYLIDFKKGVEFKTYATHDLPHARVIAVESEREFGLSVLQRLDAELKRRGDLYRNAGVQDVAGYREKQESSGPRSNGTGERNGESASPYTSTLLPRILLIVDEFQEFFVEDDKIAQEASLLLDRLVRQGRAFGLHVLLGSQTLGGAYSLARATIDQMAVRIALQCSEADANLILSKDNNAARLLSRPGEAIYNDANGLVEGNDIFQVVWLDEDRREEYLSKLRRRADEAGWRPPSPTIVFEGNLPADIEKNHRIERLLQSGSPASRERFAWLGDAMAIKEPTAATFRRASGSNLLLVGQQGDAARAVVAASAAALAAQHIADEPTGGLPPVTILDGSPADDPLAGYFPRLGNRLAPIVRFAPGRDAAAVIGEFAQELARRQQEPDAINAPLFLVVYGLQRFRDLRKSEDDFGFGRRGEDKKVSPSEAFLEVVREGPALGIHVIAWVDSLANAQRSLDRAGMREFDQRVLFQMGVADSSTLIDSPAASRLGANRALYATEELSMPEKFRPYRLPPEEWLEAVGRRLQSPTPA